MPQFFILILLLLVLPAVFPTALPGAEGQPLYERLAYNRITLTPEEGGEIFDILPVNFPLGEPPRPQPKTGDITIRFVEFPTEEYQISWSTIAKFQSFNDLVFEELQEKQPILLQQINAIPQQPPGAKMDDSLDAIQKSLNSLFGYYEYLSQSRTSPPQGLETMYREFLWGEAVYYSKVRKWVMAVTRLEQIYNEQRNYPGLLEQWNRTFNEILKETTPQKDYVRSRAWIRHLESRFPESAIAKRWTTFYTNHANRLKDESLKAFEQKSDLLAYEKIREAIDVYPEGSGIKETAQTIHERFPSVVVGVNESAKGLNFEKKGVNRSFAPFPMSSFTRPQRLVSRSFVEQVGFRVEGGHYQSPFGTLSTEEQGQVLKLRFDSSVIPAQAGIQNNAEPVGGYEIAESLLRFTDTAFNPVAFLWLGKIDSFEMHEPEQITIRLTAPTMLPESFFRIPIDRVPLEGGRPARQMESALNTGETPTLQSGPYVFYSHEILPETSEEKTTFVFNEQYTFPFPNGPKMIQEQTVSDTKKGLQLLAQGKLCALERVAPWDVEKDPNISKTFNVGKYAIPSIHFLVPNPNRPLASSRTFRRALLYGMNRHRILQQLFGTAPGAGTSSISAEVLSGIAPKGTSSVDPIGYGYNVTINPRRYDPKLAVALCLITLTHARDRGDLNENDRPKKPRSQQLTDDVPEIVLAHPNHSAALEAVQAIRREWEAIGIPVELVPYSDDEPIGRGKRVDFWYVSCQIAEPMVDIPVIFSGEGVLGNSSTYMEIALNRLTNAKTWPDIANHLHEIHRISFEETTVLPLWMWKDYYIFRKDVQGFNENPLPNSPSSSNKSDLLHFYQSVEYWRVPFYYDSKP